MRNCGSIALALAVSIFIGCLFTETASAQGSKPRAVLLAIGIEKYDLEHLNRLNFVAEDAIDVARSLTDVAEIDPERSRILIADREWRGNGPIPQHVAGIEVEHFDRIEFTTVNEVVDSFFQGVDRYTPSEDAPEEIVFVYLGGHGEAIPGSRAGVSYLPSNFQEDFTRD